MITMTYFQNKFFLLLLFSISYQFVNGQDLSSTASAPEIYFEETFHDFGDIIQNEKVTHTFKFENKGSAPLIISNIITTCGCTAPEWPKSPIKPGGTESIEIVFDSRGKSGIQNKVITIISNASTPQSRIKIKVNVLQG